jgi:uncharacterized protein YbjT (DUF2867 family)
VFLPYNLSFFSTGAQGKSVIAAVARFNAAHPQNKFKIRGIVRRTDSDVAKQLRAELGDQLEFISANMTNATEIGAALEGTSHLYAITQPFDSDSHGKEYEIGVGISNAAKKAYVPEHIFVISSCPYPCCSVPCSGVKYVWWSSLPDTDEVSGGQASVPHFTDKKRVEVELKKAGLHVISVGPAFYFANWGTYFAPRKLENNVFQWTLPFNADTHVATYAPEDTGLVVGATLENPDDFVGKCTFLLLPYPGDLVLIRKPLQTFQ